MFDMGDKKYKYQYAKIVDGKAVLGDGETLEERYGITKEKKEIVEGTIKEAFESFEKLKNLTATGLDIVTTKKGFDLGEERERYVKVSRSMLKDNAFNIGRGSERKPLELVVKEGEIARRDTISGRATGLGVYLQTKWASENLNSEGYFVIKRGQLSKIAKEVDTTPQRVKQYLAELGRYAYRYITPIRRMDDNKTRVTDEFKFLWTVKVIRTVEGEVKEGFITDKEAEYLDKKYGFEEIWVKPCERYRGDVGMDELGRRVEDNEEKKLLAYFGNVFADEGIYTVPPKLSDMGKKLFYFTSANVPTQRIGFEKLAKHLQITDEQLSEQGKPRIQERITKGMEELFEIGHLEKWSYSEKKDMYYLKYTNKYIKHNYFVGNRRDKKTKKEKIVAPSKIKELEKEKEKLLKKVEL